MKTIGRTNEGDYLVSMNSDEHRAFAMLAQVEEGWTEMEAYYADPSISFIDLSTPIGAIRHYVQSKERLIALQRLLNDVEDILSDPDETHEDKMVSDDIS